jgi:hypothetical protein
LLTNLLRPMKKNFLAIVALVLVAGSLSGQVLYKKGSVDFAAGVGLVPTNIVDGASYSVLPVSARFGVRVSPNFSVSAYAAYAASEKLNVLRPDETIDNIYNKEVSVGVRGALHAIRAERFDVYGGLMLGYHMPSTEVTNVSGPKDTNPTGLKPSFSRGATNQMIYTGFVGASYFPGRNVGIYGEIGYGMSLFNTGIQWKLR